MVLDQVLALFDQLDTADGMFLVDAEQRIIRWNASAERILGWPAAEALGSRCYELIAGREDSSTRHCRRNCPVILNALRGRQVRDYDLLCTTPAGEVKWLNFTVLVPLRRHGGGYALHIFRDVTARRRIEEFARSTVTALRGLQAGDGHMDEQSQQAPAPPLSRREEQVLHLIATGMRTRQIAEALGVRPITARNHVTRLLNKLGAVNRVQAVVYASQRGLV
ncbi:MAG: PAS domain-containing protein [Chloroflexi bacterium]|nr:PAS domain-containing protein [Chloroflexota bacterium]